MFFPGIFRKRGRGKPPPLLSKISPLECHVSRQVRSPAPRNSAVPIMCPIIHNYTLPQREVSFLLRQRKDEVLRLAQGVVSNSWNGITKINSHHLDFGKLSRRKDVRLSPDDPPSQWRKVSKRVGARMVSSPTQRSARPLMCLICDVVSYLHVQAPHMRPPDSTKNT